MVIWYSEFDCVKSIFNRLPHSHMSSFSNPSDLVVKSNLYTISVDVSINASDQRSADQ